MTTNFDSPVLKKSLIISETDERHNPYVKYFIFVRERRREKKRKEKEEEEEECKRNKTPHRQSPPSPARLRLRRTLPSSKEEGEGKLGSGRWWG